MNGFVKHLPNFLTGLRIASAPALAFLLVRGADRAALGVFAFAGLSDAADGFLAKRFGLATRFGRFLDPAADKLLMIVSFATLTVLNVTPLWLTSLVLARDTAIVVGLVAITPTADFVGPMSALILGGLAAIPSYFADLLFAASSALFSLARAPPRIPGRA